MTEPSAALVLIVDDTPVSATLLQLILEAAGYAVVAAQDGATAIQVALARQPQLILLDVMMPGMDGYEVCSVLKSDPATRHIPVIFVTASDEPESESLGFSLGAADYITKPYKQANVLSRVKTHVGLYGRQKSLEGMFHSVMEFAPDAFILIDQNGVIVRVNTQAERLFGYRRENLVGQLAETLIPGQATPDPNQSSPVESMSVPCQRSDGSVFPADINLARLTGDDDALTMAVVRDVSERQRAKAELSESRQQVRDLAAQHDAAREDERKHIAREVHDELGQVLTALRVDLSLMRMRFGVQFPELGEHTGNMKVLVDRAIQGVRNVATNLRPAVLDLGLVPALQWLCNEFSERTATVCELRLAQPEMALEETRSVVVFRIVQESLTNIARYAAARHVVVTLDKYLNALVLQVRDDGQGFDIAAASRKKTFGLLGMRERAIALGGSLQIDSVPGQGTVIQVSIPMTVNTPREAG